MKDKRNELNIPFTLKEKRFQWQTDLAGKSCEISGTSIKQSKKEIEFKLNNTIGRRENLMTNKYKFY